MSKSSSESLSAFPSNSDKSNDTINDIDEIDKIETKTKRGKGADYKIEKIFESKQQLVSELQANLNDKDDIKNFCYENEMYRRVLAKETEVGHKDFFICSIKDCNVKAFILSKYDSDNYSLFLTNDQHDHEQVTNNGIPKETKEAINKLFDLGITKPKLILNSLNDCDIIIPKLSQLRIQ